jgi:TolB protein
MTRTTALRILSVALAIIVIGLFSGLAVKPAGASTMVITESQLTTDPATQSEPDIDGIHVVYQDNRNGNWDIYMFTLQGTFTPETRITNNTYDQVAPQINGNRIVYQDNRNSDVETGRHWDIYMYDLVTQIETRITNNSATQQNPAIYGNRIVWEDNRNGHWDIYMYDLGSQTETRLTFSGTNRYPAIYGDRIVYTKETTDSLGYPVHNIYRIDLPGTQEIFVSQLHWDYMDVNVLPHPAVYADRLVYENIDVYWNGALGWWDNDENIHMKDLRTGGEWKTTNLAYQMYPDISDSYIVYQDDRNRNLDIYLYHLDRQTETQVTNNTASQSNPAIDDGRCVYQDDRNGNIDIYLATIGYILDTPVPTPPPSPGTPSTSPGSGSISNNGSLYVASYPTGATILIDGTNRGTTGHLVSNVPAGNRNLTLTKDGYQPYTTVVNVPANDVKALAPITLVKGGPSPTGTGTLYITSYPTNATILINGTDYGTTNKFVSNVPAGNQNLTLTKAGYQPYTTTVNVPVGDMKVLAPFILSASPSVSDCAPPCKTGGYLGTCVCPIGG